METNNYIRKIRLIEINSDKYNTICEVLQDYEFSITKQFVQGFTTFILEVFDKVELDGSELDDIFNKIRI